MGMKRQVHIALARFLGQPFKSKKNDVLQKVLRDPHQSLARQADVADVRDVHQRADEMLQLANRYIGDIPSGNHHVANRGRPAKIVQNLVVTFLGRRLKTGLLHLGHIVADQIHPRAVAAVLGTGGQQLRQDLGRVPMGEPFDHPHVRLMQTVSAGLGMTGPLAHPVAEGRQHVAAQWVAPKVLLVHRVEHLRGEQQRHRCSLALILFDARKQVLGKPLPQDLLQLSKILDRVSTLPQRAFPLRRGDFAVSGKARPVRLHERALERISKWLPRCSTLVEL